MIDRISQSNIQSMLETLRAYQTQATGTVADGNPAAAMWLATAKLVNLLFLNQSKVL